VVTALNRVIENRDLKSEVSNIVLVERPWDIPGTPVLNLISEKSFLSTRATQPENPKLASYCTPSHANDIMNSDSTFVNYQGANQCSHRRVHAQRTRLRHALETES
jgi:hypothetical protein